MYVPVQTPAFAIHLPFLQEGVYTARNKGKGRQKSPTLGEDSRWQHYDAVSLSRVGLPSDSH
jgi:hypothetical protein